MLKLTKKGDKYWLFDDIEIGLFSPSKFTINLELNEIVIVYENGLKSKRYNVIDCEIYNLGELIPFTTSSGDLFMQKLEELNCPCFQKNENIYNISGSWGSITGTLSDQTDLQNVLDSKVDKVTTTGVERVYTINPDGSQGTKATSNFKDIIEGYFNGTNFYTDALFTNLITPESSKIYINIAVTPATQYRWSVSAYVQLSSGINFPSDGKTYGVKDGVAVRVQDFDFFNPYTSDYFVGTIRPQGANLTSFLLTGVLNTWGTTGTLEGYTEVGELTLVGLKTTSATAGSSLQFLATSGRSRFYTNPSKNKAIHRFIFRNSDAVAVANARFFVGLYAGNTVPIGNVNPSTLINCIGFGADSGDTNIHLIHNDNTGLATKVDLGINFPANTQNTDTYKAYFFLDKHNNKLYARLERLNTGHDTGVLEVTTDIFAINKDLDPYIWRNNGSTALEVKMRIGGYLSANKIL